MPDQPGVDLVNDLVHPEMSPSQSQQQPDVPLPLPQTAPASPSQAAQGPGQPGAQQPTPDGPGGAKAATADFQAALGEGWEYDPEAMQAQIGRLEDLLNTKVRTMEQYTDRITGILAPGSEVVSRRFTDVANPSGESHNTQLARYRDYLVAYIETLKEINRAYQEQDEAALDALKEAEV